MEEYILKMINTGPDNGNECLANKIADHFEKFIDWCIINIAKVAFKGGEQQSDTYMHCDEEIYFNSISELYTYWDKNFNNKP